MKAQRHGRPSRTHVAERLAMYREALPDASLLPWRGYVVEANGQSLIAEGLAGRVGEVVEVRTAAGATREGEIIGFERTRASIMLLQNSNGDDTSAGNGTGGANAGTAGMGIRYGDEVVALGLGACVPVSDSLMGRVVNARAEPIDGRGLIGRGQRTSLEPAAPRPFARVPIDEPLSTGVRALDGLLPIGRGQRIGIFGGSGVGKSTLLGMVTRNCAADVVVIGLVGERGREVLEFLNESLGEQGRAKSVVVVGTSDEAPLLKLRTAFAATSVAEFFAAQGKQVLLILDSLTRFAMAAREVGLAAGEPPTNKGYTPSVFSRLARLIERAGRFHQGSITAFYTVLMEADDEHDPIVDAVRSFVDGHLMLSREMALEGWYPPIDMLRSVSRLMNAVATPAHLADAAAVRRQLAIYARSEDLVRIGAYRAGMDLDLDRAMAGRAEVRAFLEQRPDEVSALAATLTRLKNLAEAAA